MSKRKTGTKEWSTQSINIQKGCSRGCRYCYAHANSKFMPNLMPASGDWRKPQHMALKPKYPKYDGVVMFPTTHDIEKHNIDICFWTLTRLLEAGNQVLIVTKPTLACVTQLCHTLQRFRTQIMWRFTIGSIYDEVLSYWEPGAPCYVDRINSLVVARSHGYRTSVSIEPMLGNRADTVELVHRIESYITDTIWIGKLNKAAQRVRCSTPEDVVRLKEVLDEQTPAKIAQLYDALCDHPKVRWKESIAAELGLEAAEDTWSED